MTSTDTKASFGVRHDLKLACRLISQNGPCQWLFVEDAAIHLVSGVLIYIRSNVHLFSGKKSLCLDLRKLTKYVQRRGDCKTLLLLGMLVCSNDWGLLYFLTYILLTVWCFLLAGSWNCNALYSSLCFHLVFHNEYQI
jgi:hypothetical protein